MAKGSSSTSSSGGMKRDSNGRMIAPQVTGRQVGESLGLPRDTNARPARRGLPRNNNPRQLSLFR